MRREFTGISNGVLGRFRQQGHPVHATVSDMGPLLLSRVLNLNETQTGVLALVFKVADDKGLLLLDLKDLRAMLQYVGDNAQEFQTSYGNVSGSDRSAQSSADSSSLEQQGADKFLGEPMLNIDDLLQTEGGRGVVNILAADRLHATRRQLYATLLLWLLSELYERLPEVGDRDKPKLVFFFDEAHLLFTDAPKVLLDQHRAGGAAHPFERRGCVSSSRRTRWTCRTRCSGSSATASSTRCARSRRATRKRSRRRPRRCAPTRSSTRKRRSPSSASARR